MSLSQGEREQYSRHLILNEIGEEGQLKLKNARVLMIGAGGLGCPVLQYLTAAGVGTIGIVDNDTIDESNLQRQILYTVDDIGLPKAEIAAQRLSQLNPFVNFEVHVTALTRENAIGLFQDYDIIVDGTDNFPTRYLTNDASVLTDKPLVFGSIFKFDGQVSVFNYQGGPTYRCLYPDPPAANSVPNCSEIGVLGVLPGIIGSLQANEVLKMICGIGEVLSGQLLTFDALTLNQFKLKFQKNESLKITELLPSYEFFCGINPIEEIKFSELKDLKDDYETLDVRNLEEREILPVQGIHIPLHELEERWEEVPSNKTIVVACKSGIRSKQAIEILKEMNFENNLINLKGGLG